MPEHAPEHPEQHGEPAAETRKFSDLMGRLAEKYGSIEMAAQVLDKDSDVAAAVILKWYKHGITPSPQIQKTLLSSLAYLARTDIGRIGLGPKKLLPPIKAKPNH